MNTAFIVLLMIFCHIVDDYYLQGWLASAKQKKWWEENAPNKLYKYDYIWALIMHSFSWAFMIMLPIAYVYNFKINVSFIVCLIANLIAHASTDHEKANKFTINLWVDQVVHLSQILLTALILL
jgi:hypothetical protein